MPETKDSKQALTSAFEFLEDMVEKKLIRYYGITSPAIGLQSYSRFNIQAMAALTMSICTENHLKLFQFPLNMIENDILNVNGNGINIISKCRELGYTAFSNRPLNAYLPDGSLLRLAKTAFKPDKEKELEEEFAEICKNSAAINESILETSAWENMSNSWRYFYAAEEAEVFFHQIFFPALLQSIPIDGPDFANVHKWLKRVMIAKATFNMARRTRSFFHQVYPDSHLTSSDFAPAAIRYCQLKGVDCVLTASRKPAYFDNIKHLLS